MKLLLILLAKILNSLPKTDFILVHWCHIYRKYGLDKPNLVGMDSAPTVATDTTPTSVTYNSAVFDTNNISATGGQSPTVRGICWVSGSGGTPTTSNSKTTENGTFGTGTFSATATGLTHSTTYSVRAYATNSVGTGYGSTVEVTTSSNTAPTTTLGTPDMVVATYYFDASISGPTDPGSAWDYDAYGFDGIEANDCIGYEDGSKSSNYLDAKGTNAPSLSTTITQVRARIKASTSDGDYVTLNAPTGGWTWSKIEKLEIRLWQTGHSVFSPVTYAGIYIEGDAGGTELGTPQRTGVLVSILEIEVTSAPTITDTTPDLKFTGTDAQSDAVDYQVQVDTVNTFDSQISYNVVADSNATSDADYNIQNSTNGFPERGQSFTGNGGTLTGCKFKLSKIGSPTGNMVAKIYNHTGTFGSSSLPTGSALATSDNFDVSSLDGTPTENTITFSGVNQISLVNGTYYVITLYYGSGSSTDSPKVSVQTTGSTAHNGNAAYYSFNNSAWQTSTNDLLFQVLTTLSTPLISALSTDHTGFSAGESHPTASGVEQTYTVQAALDPDTYYWRSRAIDPSGSNTWGTWSSTKSFVINSRPVVTLSSPADDSNTSDTTPDLVFTGTDTESNDIRYSVQVDTSPIFQSQTGTSVSNLVPNSSFENLTGGWADNWTRTDTTFTIDVTGEGQAPASTNSLKATLSSSSSKYCRSAIFNVDYTKTYYFSFTLKLTAYSAGSLDWAFDEYDSGSSWVSWQYKSYKNTTGTWQITGTYTPTGSGVSKAQLYFYHAASSTLTAYIDNVQVYEVNAAALGAKVSITTDDCLSSIYSNRSIFSSRGIPVTQFVISDLVGITGYQSWSEIKDTYDNLGWQVGNHSKTHTDFTTLSEAQLVTEISTCQSAVTTNVGVTPVDLAFPFGTQNALARQVASRYIIGMRDYSGSGENQPPYETTAIRGKSVENTDTVTTVKGWIDAAITGDYWLVLVFHDLVASSPTQYQWTVADMESLLDYINLKSAQNLIKTTTLEQGRNTLSNRTSLITATSGTDNGFSGSPDNTDPFTSGQAVTYTVQSSLTAGNTYYWRVKGLDPSGTNTYGVWSTARSFNITSAGGITTSVNVGGVWKTVVSRYVNIDGTWKSIDSISTNIGGTWKNET